MWITICISTFLELRLYIPSEHLFWNILQHFLHNYFSGKDKYSILACKSLCKQEWFCFKSESSYQEEEWSFRRFLINANVQMHILQMTFSNQSSAFIFWTKLRVTLMQIIMHLGVCNRNWVYAFMLWTSFKIYCRNLTFAKYLNAKCIGQQKTFGVVNFLPWIFQNFSYCLMTYHDNIGIKTDEC